MPLKRSGGRGGRGEGAGTVDTPASGTRGGALAWSWRGGERGEGAKSTGVRPRSTPGKMTKAESGVQRQSQPRRGVSAARRPVRRRGTGVGACREVGPGSGVEWGPQPLSDPPPTMAWPPMSRPVPRGVTVRRRRLLPSLWTSLSAASCARPGVTPPLSGGPPLQISVLLCDRWT